MKKFKYLLLIVCFVFCFGGIGVAEQPKVIGFFDKQTVDVDDEMKYTLKIVGDVGTLPRPKLPEIPGFDIYYVSRASNFVFVEGESVPEVNYLYVFVPKTVGSYTIPAFTVVIDEVSYSTKPVAINVISLKGDTLRTQPYRQPYVAEDRNTPFAKQADVHTNQTLPQTSPPVTNDGNIFARVEADKAKLYPNEQVTLTYSIFVNSNYAYTAFYKGFKDEPDFKNFWVEEVTDQKDLLRGEVYFKGQRYLRAGVKKIALFPTRSGTFSINVGSLKVDVQKIDRRDQKTKTLFDDNFSGQSVLSKLETMVLPIDEVTLLVSDFPLDNKPVHFGGVSGEYQIKAFTDKTETRLNEPIVLTVMIEGKGNLETMGGPHVPADIHGFSLFETNSSLEKSVVNGQLRGKKAFQYIFLPDTVGDQELPLIDFDFFSTKYKKYMTLQRGPFPVTVQPLITGDKKQTLSDTQVVPDELKSTIQTESSDIRYIKQKIKQTGKVMRAYRMLLVVINLLLCVALMLTIIFKKRQRQFDSDGALKRKHFAYDEFKKAYKQIQGLRKKENPLYFENAANILNNYFADIFDLSAYGLTWELIQERLLAAGVEKTVIAQCEDLYETCNFARFATSNLESESYAKVDTALKEIGSYLEKHIS